MKTMHNLPIYLMRLALLPMMWLLAACADSEADLPAGGRLTLVLDISGAPALSRSDRGGEQEAQSLRVIVARPDGRVEANRLVVPGEDAADTGQLLIDIAPDAWKTVYLLANEASAGIDAGAVASTAPEALDDPSLHPADLVSMLVEEVDPEAPAPMTAVYRIATGAQYARPDGHGRMVVSYSVHLMRTTARLTFNIENRRPIPVCISSLAIYGVEARHHWLFPHVATTDGRQSVHYLTAAGTALTESGTSLAPGGSAATPATDYFRDRYLASSTGYGSRTIISEPVEVAPQGVLPALTFIQSECAVPDGADPDEPFWLQIEFDGNVYTAPLDNLPALPRNTDVQVNITFTDTGRLIEVEVRPYQGVDLNPGFGQTTSP